MTDLTTAITIQAEPRYVFNYNRKENITTITKKFGDSTETTIVKGFVAVTVTTEGDGLRVDY